MDKVVRLKEADLKEFIHGVLGELSGFSGPSYAKYSECFSVGEFGDAVNAARALLVNFDPEKPALGVPESFVKAAHECLRESPWSLRSVQQKKSTITPKSDLQHHYWQLNMALGSSECSRLEQPLVSLDLTTSSETVSVELDRRELDRLISSLQSAFDAMS